MQVPEIILNLGPWNWFILAAILITLEILLPGFFLLFLGLAAVITGAIAMMTDLSWQFQWLLFAGLSITLVWLASKYWVYSDEGSERPLLNRRADRHVGRTFVLVEPIVNGTGKVRIGDSLWMVRGPDLPEGAKVKVTKAVGATLHVDAEAT